MDLERFYMFSGRKLSRREILQRAVLLGASLPATTALLAACAADRATDDESADDSTELVDDQAGDADDLEAVDDDALDAEELGFDLSEVPDDFEVDLDELLADAEQSFNVGPEHGWNVPELDPVNLDAGLPGDAEYRRYENPYVGDLSEDLLIAISLSDPYGDDPRDAWVYLCDGQSIARWLNGEVDADGGTLAEGELEVSFSITDDEITGDVTLPGEDPQSFTALPAGDNAGLFQTEYTVDEVEATVRWIVHEDGRQRGQEICCTLVCFSGGCAPVCWPCQHRF